MTEEERANPNPEPDRPPPEASPFDSPQLEEIDKGYNSPDLEQRK